MHDLQLTQFGGTLSRCQLKLANKSAEGSTKLCQLKIFQNTVIKMNALGRFFVLDFSRYVARSLFTKDFLGNTQKYTSHDADPIFAFWAQSGMYITLLTKIADV